MSNDSFSDVPVISILSDFSCFPCGRFKKHGPYSGEALRDDHIVPALERHQKVLIDLNGVMGYASSFLEEAFGGLVRLGYDKEALFERLVIIGGSKDDRDRIKAFIQEAS